MTTEFGGVSGIFPADQVTSGFLDHRRELYQSQATKPPNEVQIDDVFESEEVPLYFRADPDANYYKKLKLDLSQMNEFLGRLLF